MYLTKVNDRDNHLPPHIFNLPSITPHGFVCMQPGKTSWHFAKKITEQDTEDFTKDTHTSIYVDGVLQPAFQLKMMYNFHSQG